MDDVLEDRIRMDVRDYNEMAMDRRLCEKIGVGSQGSRLAIVLKKNKNL